MAKKLTTQTKIKRLRAEGYSRKDLARSFGVSVSAIGRAERGQSSGKTIEAQTNQFYKLGKRAKSAVIAGDISLPSAKPAPAPKVAPAPASVKEPERVDPMRRFEGHLSQLDGDSKVVIYINMENGGRVRLGAHGGIYVSTILDAPSVEDFVYMQGGDQGYKINWDNVVSIVPEEYY